MRKGTVVLIPFPFTNLSGTKVRPAIVLHEEKGGEDCIVAYMSTSERKLLSSDVTVSPSEKNGLKIRSVIRMSKLATLQKKTILGEIGTLEPVILNEADEKLRKLFKL